MGRAVYEHAVPPVPVFASAVPEHVQEHRLLDLAEGREVLAHGVLHGDLASNHVAQYSLEFLEREALWGHLDEFCAEVRVVLQPFHLVHVLLLAFHFLAPFSCGGIGVSARAGTNSGTNNPDWSVSRGCAVLPRRSRNAYFYLRKRSFLLFSASWGFFASY